MTLYPQFPPGMKIPKGAVIRFNKPNRWLAIADWFSKWEKWMRGLPDVTRTEQNRMFITHQLHNDLQRTCHSMHDIVQEHVVGNPYRKWIPRRFSQDVLESFFSEIRQSAGGNTDCCRPHVDRSIQYKRSKRVDDMLNNNT